MPTPVSLTARPTYCHGGSPPVPPRPAVDDGIERFESESATALHRVSGVNGQIQDDQLNLGWIGPEVSSQHRLQLYLPAQRHAEQIAHADDLLVEIDVLRLEPPLAGGGKELLGQINPRSAAARISSTPS
jgi:hypothetical protein